MKRLLTILAVAAALAIPGTAAAYSLRAQETVNLPKGETRTGTYYALGQVVTIDGNVNGDLVCAGQTVTVTGAVKGDVLCAGQTVTINGPVEGNVRLAGQMLYINGSVGRNVTVGGQSFTLGDSARVSGDMGLLGQIASLGGQVAKDVYGNVDQLTIKNSVGPVDMQLGFLTLGENSKINGNLAYTSNNASNIDKSKVTGDIKHSLPVVHQSEQDTAAGGLAIRFYWILAALVIGMTLVVLLPRLVRATNKTMLSRPRASIGWGILIALLAPVLTVILLVTTIGIPLAILVAVSWIVLMATSSIFAGMAFGHWLLQRANWQENSLAWAALLGLPVIVIVLSVPVVGPLLGLLATWWAAGGLVITIQNSLKD